MLAASTSMPMSSYDISYSDKSQTPFLLILQNQIIFFSFHNTNYVEDLNQLGFHFYVVRLPSSVLSRRGLEIMLFWTWSRGRSIKELASRLRLSGSRQDYLQLHKKRPLLQVINTPVFHYVIFDFLCGRSIFVVQCNIVNRYSSSSVFVNTSHCLMLSW